MTKKDFEVIARVIANLPPIVFSGVLTAETGRRYVAEAFARELALKNPRFKADVWYRACVSDADRTPLGGHHESVQ